MSDSDNLPPTIYHTGTSGTISGFTSNDSSLANANISLQMLYAKISEVENNSLTNYNPSILKSLLLQHISDTNNPHHDTFASLGFDVAYDLVGSLLPGTVPSQAPSYVLEPSLLLPNANLPATNDLPQYISDLNPIVETGSDNGDNNKSLVWLDDTATAISLKDFLDSKNSYGYSLLPTVSVGLGVPGLLCLDSLTLFSSLTPDAFSVDANTKKDGYLWSLNTTDRDVKLLPTYKVNVNTGNTDLRETTYLWAGLNNMSLGNKPYVYVVFSINGNKLVVRYTNNGADNPVTLDVVYKSGYIEPVLLNDYSMGGVRFLAKDQDTLTVNWTITGTPDWSNYKDSDITFSGGDVTFTQPNFYNTRFILGNPNLLSGYTRNGLTSAPVGIALNDPVTTNTSTSKLSWELPLLSKIENIGMFSLTVCVDYAVDGDKDPVTIFTSDKLTISLVIKDDGTSSSSTWNISTKNGDATSNISLKGSGGYLQSIALSSDGASLRVRVSGSSGIAQIPSNVILDNLPNSKFLPFNGAVMGLEVYGISDDGSTLDFLIGDTTNS